MNQTQGVCSLCKRNRVLKRGHIIPRFAGKWIKDTSATGLLRGVTNPNKRLQDLSTKYFLCGECEQTLSKYESYFAKKVFFPFFKDNIEGSVYDITLLKFIISLAWRTLVFTYDIQIDTDPWIKHHLDMAEKSWRGFLLGKERLDESYEHHLIFLDYVKPSNLLPNDVNWYTLRGTDATLGSNNDTVFCYTHLPWMIMYSTIFPKKSNGWNNTQIYSQGKLTKIASIKDPVFGDFLLNRIRMATLYKMNDSRIVKSMLRNPDRLLRSETLKTFLSEERRKRNRDLPASILHIVELLEGTQRNSELSDLDLNFLSLHYNFIADRLSTISKQEALKIHTRIVEMINRSNNMMRDAKCEFRVNGVHLQYLVNFCSSKQDQRQIMNEEMVKLEKQNPTDFEYYLVISYNPIDPGAKFEMGAYLGTENI